jgi:hypothetical protein
MYYLLEEIYIFIGNGNIKKCSYVNKAMYFFKFIYFFIAKRDTIIYCNCKLLKNIIRERATIAFAKSPPISTQDRAGTNKFNEMQTIACAGHVPFTPNATGES